MSSRGGALEMTHLLKVFPLANIEPPPVPNLLFERLHREVSNSLWSTEWRTPTPFESTESRSTDAGRILLKYNLCLSPGEPAQIKQLRETKRPKFSMKTKKQFPCSNKELVPGDG
jgi:hypothetical protein